MEETALDTPKTPNPFIKIYLVGGMIGTLIGLAGSYLLVKNSQRTGEEIEISTSEWIRLALLVFGLLRSVATLHED
jgi:ABC-type uncharacterized transport system permease subunit